MLAETGAADTVGLARAIRDGRTSMRQVGALAATVARAASEGDAVAADLVARAADEALRLADVVTRAAWGADASIPPGTPAVLAGGLFGDPGFREAVAAGLHGARLRPAAAGVPPGRRPGPRTPRGATPPPPPRPPPRPPPHATPKGSA
ncbi:hypothetical protein ACRAWC_22520 [Leifsonia sp. L25]|uniref:hypothetical protein n=1 Tax=Leifsonia sp. L25 TaxID=3423957 RepID=UPI003D68C2E1